MLTEKPSKAAEPAASHAPAPGAAVERDLDDLIAYFEGAYVPLRDAKVSVMTHSFMYGTATFEGIRAYWNADHRQLYGVFIREHVERIRKSARILLMDDIPSTDELAAIVLETARRNHYEGDTYIRPSFYKSTRAIGVKLHHLEHRLTVIAVPFGDYVDTTRGIRIMTSSWRRNADEALPARGKIVGGYVNMAFQKSEAELNGFDEALVLTPGGHASEASAANLFVVRDGVVITPPVSDDILEGVTRNALLGLSADLGFPTEVRSIDRSELYVADEVFLCGTGVQVSPVVEVDHRAVGSGAVGPIASAIRARYFDAVRGRLPEYRDWLTPINDAG
jgi:branched-chain amino acid aminotransferase